MASLAMISPFHPSSLRSESEIISGWRDLPAGFPVRVSIVCITYNQERYIEDAICGFLSQCTDFPFEIVIHDDASTDRTLDIVQHYKSRYPNLIRVVAQKENQYSKGVSPWFDIVFPCVNGDFIAICEGDDYWLSPSKLQSQFDAMNSLPQVSSCFHGTYVLSSSDGVVPFQCNANVLPRKELLTKDFVYGNPVGYCTCSAMIRVADYVKIEDRLAEFAKYKIGDWPLWVLLSSVGQVISLPGLYAVYRQHSCGVWTSMAESDRILRSAEIIAEFAKVLPKVFLNDINRSLGSRVARAMDFACSDEQLVRVKSLLHRNVEVINQDFYKGFVIGKLRKSKLSTGLNMRKDFDTSAKSLNSNFELLRAWGLDSGEFGPLRDYFLLRTWILRVRVCFAERCFIAAAFAMFNVMVACGIVVKRRVCYRLSFFWKCFRGSY